MRNCSPKNKSILTRYLQLACVAGSLAFVVFAHWVYYGCESAKDTSAMGRLKDLGQTCPIVGVLPVTPIQNVILHYLPFGERGSKAAYQLACKRSNIFSPHSTLCESLFGLSFVSAIAEWIFYFTVAYKILKTVILRPFITRLCKILIFVCIGIFVSRFLQQYGPLFIPRAYLGTTLRVATSVETLAIEFLAFLWGTVISLHNQVKAIVSLENIPGENLYKHLQGYWVSLRGGAVF